MEYSTMEQYWIWLSSVDGIGPSRFYRLLSQYEDAHVVWDDPDDEGRAMLIEDFLRNELDRLPFERLNDMQERTAPIQGGSWFLCEWDNSGHTHTTVGELAVSLLHPKQVIPQAGVSDPKEMDYIIMRSSQTKKAVRRKYGVDVSAESESDPECRTVGSSAYGDGTAGNSDELVTLNTAYYRGDRGGIGRFSVSYTHLTLPTT